MLSGFEILKDKKGLIFGALNEHSIAWKVAEKCKEAGADIVLTNTYVATQIGNITQLTKEKGIPFVSGDATQITDIKNILIEAQQILGGKIDFVLHSVAQSQNIRRHREYDNLNYDYFVQTIDASALSLHKLIQSAMQLDAIAEGGSIVTLTFIASERYFVGYNDMADAKAMLESIVRQMGAIYGESRHVRVNAISQSAIPTKAGEQWEQMEYYYLYANDLSPLGSATAEDCANLCVALFSDLTRMVTMQTIYNDGGFSHTLLTPQMMKTFKNLQK